MNLRRTRSRKSMRRVALRRQKVVQRGQRKHTAQHEQKMACSHSNCPEFCVNPGPQTPVPFCKRHRSPWPIRRLLTPVDPPQGSAAIETQLGSLLAIGSRSGFQLSICRGRPFHSGHKKSNRRRMPGLSFSSPFSRISGICRRRRAGPCENLCRAPAGRLESD
jgi:hypothetical protein